MQKRLTVPSGEAAARLDERRREEAAPSTRTEAQRDRDRVLYSSAFHRLAGITQVSASESGHTFHTRLTHSLKVGQVGRRLAERLRERIREGRAGELVGSLDPDAVEAAALAHDLGHPPFGHVAELELDHQALALGGFEGNPQSFRILTRLALRSTDQAGLNLTRRTLNGTIK
jgi:dGTPase